MKFQILLKESEVAKILNVSVNTLQQWRVERKELPYIRIGGGVRYPEQEIKKYLERKTVRPRESKGKEINYLRTV